MDKKEYPPIASPKKTKYNDLPKGVEHISQITIRVLEKLINGEK